MVRSGLVPGEQQEHASRDQLVIGETVAILLEICQVGQQVGSRSRAARGDQLAEQNRHLPGGRFGASVFLGRIARAADEERHLVRQMLQALQLALRHAQHVHDHQGWQGAGELGDEVEFFALADPLQKPGGERLHIRTQGVNGAHVEDLARHTTQARVLRRIAEHHPHRQDAHQLRDAFGFPRRQRCKKRAQPVRGHPAIQAYSLDVVVAREHPGLEDRAPVRRVLISHALVKRERIRQHRRVVRTVIDAHLWVNPQDRQVSGRMPAAAAMRKTEGSCVSKH